MLIQRRYNFVFYVVNKRNHQKAQMPKYLVFILLLSSKTDVF